jgi:hypothetical protein
MRGREIGTITYLFPAEVSRQESLSTRSAKNAIINEDLGFPYDQWQLPFRPLVPTEDILKAQH